MKDLFVYSWFYTGYQICGHCLDKDGNYELLKIDGFKPSCYVEGNVGESRTMIPSRNISIQKEFRKLSFDNMNSMLKFISENRQTPVYMADIQHVNVFLSEMGLDYVGWIRLDQEGNIEPSSDVRLITPRVMAFDIEVKSSDSGMPKPYRLSDTVEMISVIVDTKKILLHRGHIQLDDVETIRFDDEIDLIQGFFDLIKREDPTVITGFNIFGFDIYYLVSRLKLRLCEIPNVSRSGSPIKFIKVNWESSAYGYNQYDRMVIDGRILVDMFLYFKRMKLDKYSLAFVSEKFLGKSKGDMSFDRMMEAFKTGKGLEEVARYCIQDSVLVIELFEKVSMWIDMCEISKITRCGIEEIYTRGEQMKMISQCVKECIDRNIVLQPQPPSVWKEYEGAYVLEPKKGLYDNCCSLDFQSLYPSIIIAYNICPSTYTSLRGGDLHRVGPHCFRKHPVGILPGMIKRLLDERVAVKQQMKECDKTSVEYVVLDRRQNALKVCANSVYGMMGFQKSKYFGHVGCAESVTMVGRELLSRVVETIEQNYGVSVIYGDTDSCILYSAVSGTDMKTLGNKICDDVNEKLPEPMSLKYESYYDKVVLLSKKRYILVSGDSIKYKGVMTARRDYCKYAKDTYEGVIHMIAKGKTSESIANYIDDRMLKLYQVKCNISELIITKSLSKKLDDYKVKAPHVVFARRLSRETGTEVRPGTRLEYVYAGGTMMTPEEARNSKVDSRIYIEKQIATQVDDILEVVGLGNYISKNWM